MLLPELSPPLIPAKSHALNLSLLERVHGNGADEGDLYGQSAVFPSAFETDEYLFGC